MSTQQSSSSHSDQPVPETSTEGAVLPTQPKAGHGGRRKGVGRPRIRPPAEAAESNTLGKAASSRTGVTKQQTRSAPSATFFRPRNTNQPVPVSESASESSQPAHPASISSSVQLSREEFAQLNAQLQFVDENDEYGDIASGDQEIDDSLAEATSDNSESDAAAAQAETQSSQPARKSQLHEQLLAVHKRLQREETKHGKPLCYKRGDFFDRPQHPVFFALEQSKDTTGFDPSLLYSRKVFVWLPHLLPGHPDRFKCTCGLGLSKNGFPDDPIARRVRAMPSDYFLYTNRFICDARTVNSTGCGTDFRGSDPHIIAQLPRHVQAAFPAYISAHGAISTLMMRQMSNTFSTRLGPAPFPELVSEIQHREHADRELMYLAAANFYGVQDVMPFSVFDDPEGYAGSPPSVKYLKAVFTDFLSAIRIFIDRYTSTLPLDIAKADHTFDVLTHTGRVKGEKIFTVAYTVVNHFEEIRAHSMTSTKALNFVAEMYDGIQQGLKDSGNPPTQILYTDSPQAERGFHESINDALSKDVEPVTDWTDCAPFCLNPHIPTVTTSDSMIIEDLASDILVETGAATSSSQLFPIAVAIKTEEDSGAPVRLKTIQLRTKTLTSPSHLLPWLRAILTNPSIIKVGNSIRQTLHTISKVFSVPELGNILKDKTPPIIDLEKYAKLKGAVDQPSASLHALAGIQKQAQTDGQLVTLVQGYKPIAEGCIVGQHPGNFDAVMDDNGHTARINVSSSRSLIQISKVLLPGAIHSLHHQTMEWIFSHGKRAVVATSQLHTRAEIPPTPPLPLSRGLAAPGITTFRQRR
ncbi:hypothetical protein B0H14DRAFT_2625938 [Mycena olivaceomarginata]|nr:hypothetical protein B0H14DRAFT_2625938 [Mycena olivaceomarginata]